MFHLLFSDNDEKYIEIVNPVGELVYSARVKMNKAIIDISNKPAGMYILHVKGGNKKTSSKLIKN